MMTIELLDEAKEDIVDGGFFYRQQGGDALKDYFVDSIFASIDRLSFSANAYPVRHGCHRLLVDRFPYSVYYRIEGNIVKVWRVLDNRRDPAWIEQQLAP